MARGSSNAANGQSLLFGSRSSQKIIPLIPTKDQQAIDFLIKIQMAMGIQSAYIQPDDATGKKVLPVLLKNFVELQKESKFKVDFLGEKVVLENKEIKATYTSKGLLQSFDDEPAFVYKAQYKQPEVKYWFDQGTNHRDNGYAIKDGKYLVWVQRGKFHREDGPAVIDSGNGRRIETWYRDDQKHREDGPAETSVEDGFREEKWFQNGELHRMDGPAHSNTDGWKKWYHHGQLHNLDGPAVINPNNDKEWYARGKRHNNDGPSQSGKHYKVFYWRGKLCKSEKEYREKQAKGRPVS